MRFHSILFDRPAGSVDGDEPNEPAFFGDLNLGTATAEVIRRFGALSVPPEPAARLPTGCWSRLEVCDGRWSAAVVGEVPGDGSRPGQHHTGHR